jgi:hypothetical protein
MGGALLAAFAGVPNLGGGVGGGSVRRRRARLLCAPLLFDMADKLPSARISSNSGSHVSHFTFPFVGWVCHDPCSLMNKIKKAVNSALSDFNIQPEARLWFQKSTVVQVTLLKSQQLPEVTVEFHISKECTLAQVVISEIMATFQNRVEISLWPSQIFETSPGFKTLLKSKPRFRNHMLGLLTHTFFTFQGSLVSS